MVICMLMVGEMDLVSCGSVVLMCLMVLRMLVFGCWWMIISIECLLLIYVVRWLFFMLLMMVVMLLRCRVVLLW